jgi:hypothetical protein
MNMPSSARQQLSRLAAVLAVALLCAQTLVLTHDHQPLDDALCAVCGTSSSTAAADAALPPADGGFSHVESDTLPAQPTLPRRHSQHLSRAPPAA